MDSGFTSLDGFFASLTPAHWLAIALALLAGVLAGLLIQFGRILRLQAADKATSKKWHRALEENAELRSELDKKHGASIPARLKDLTAEVHALKDEVRRLREKIAPGEEEKPGLPRANVFVDFFKKIFPPDKSPQRSQDHADPPESS